MIFKDKLYQIQNVEINEGAIAAIIDLDPLHEIYSGHFPGNPITPGVVQLEIVKEVLSAHFNDSFLLKTVKNSKYLAVLNPVDNSTVTVNIRFEFIDDKNLNVSGDISSGEIVFMKFQCSYSKP